MAAPIAVRGSSMRTFAFTDAGLRKLPVPPKPEQADHFDTVVRGLGLRVSYGGKRSFFLMFSVGGRRCRLSLGEFGNLEDGRLSLSAARKRARVKLGEIAADKNPAAEAREARLAPTVEALVADFIEAQRRRGIRSADKQRRMLARDVLPAIGQLKARDVTRADIRRILQAVADRGAPIESNRLHEVVRRLFHFAMDESCVEANPALRLSRYRERPRERWLSLKELGSYWNALPDGAAGDALRLCLLTAQRQGNVLAMRSD